MKKALPEKGPHTHDQPTDRADDPGATVEPTAQYKELCAILLGTVDRGKFSRGLLKTGGDKGQKKKKCDDNADIGKDRRAKPTAQN